MEYFFLVLCLYFQGSSESYNLQLWSSKIGPGSYYDKSPVSWGSCLEEYDVDGGDFFLIFPHFPLFFLFLFICNMYMFIYVIVMSKERDP